MKQRIQYRKKKKKGYARVIECTESTTVAIKLVYKSEERCFSTMSLDNKNKEQEKTVKKRKKKDKNSTKNTTSGKKKKSSAREAR